MHMKSKNRLKQSLGIRFFSLVFLALLSLVGGTAAWYQYLSRAGFGFEGVSIGNTALMEIGFISNVQLDDYKAYDLSIDENNSNIYWSHSEISEDVLNYVLSSNGYAYNKLFPVSSGSFDGTSDFSLIGNPYYLEDGFTPAKKFGYLYLPLVFRVKDVDSQEYLSGKSIYLSNSSLSTRNGIDQAIRVYMKNDINSFIYNPSQMHDGETAVGGVLNLNEDMYYDYKDGKEFVYGEYENIVYTSSYSGENEVDPKDVTTFTANHKGGVMTVDKEKSTFKTAKYLGNDSLISDGKILTITGEDGIARLDLTLYLEGWDKSVINENIGSYFNLNLNFGVNTNE